MQFRSHHRNDRGIDLRSDNSAVFGYVYGKLSHDEVLYVVQIDSDCSQSCPTGNVHRPDIQSDRIESFVSVYGRICKVNTLGNHCSAVAATTVAHFAHFSAKRTYQIYSNPVRMRFNESTKSMMADGHLVLSRL